MNPVLVVPLVLTVTSTAPAFGVTAVSSASARVCAWDFLALEAVSSGGRTLVFHQPLMLEVFREDGLLVVTHEGLGLRAFGETHDELRQAIADDLVFAWEQYVLEDPQRLHASAQRNADALRAMVVAPGRHLVGSR